MYMLDGHAHLEHPDQLPVLLDTCAVNMARIQDKADPGHPVQGVLLLAEMIGQRWRNLLCSWAGEGRTIAGRRQWQVAMTAEPAALVCTSEQGDRLYCLLGSQVNTAEKIELLCFGSCPECTDIDIDTCLSTVDPGRSLVILPWGAGKWLGARGKTVLRLVRAEQGKKRRFVLGDNGNRPGIWSSVPQFQAASALGMPILRGTDPLFLPGEIERVGSFGQRCEGELDHRFPLASLLALVRDHPASLVPYGHLQTIPRFLRTQVHLRMAKRSRA